MAAGANTDFTIAESQAFMPSNTVFTAFLMASVSGFVPCAKAEKLRRASTKNKYTFFMLVGFFHQLKSRNGTYHGGQNREYNFELGICFMEVDIA